MEYSFNAQVPNLKGLEAALECGAKEVSEKKTPLSCDTILSPSKKKDSELVSYHRWQSLEQLVRALAERISIVA